MIVKFITFGSHILVIIAGLTFITSVSRRLDACLQFGQVDEIGTPCAVSDGPRLLSSGQQLPSQLLIGQFLEAWRDVEGTRLQHVT